jgi:hypothetical protein
MLQPRDLSFRYRRRAWILFGVVLEEERGPDRPRWLTTGEAALAATEASARAAYHVHRYGARVN